MDRRLILTNGKKTFEQSVKAAKEFISLFPIIEKPDAAQRGLLASAHFTLSLQNDISPQRSKMYANSAITLLLNMPERTMQWRSQMAHAYYKRAELYENDHIIESAFLDYLRALDIFKSISIDEIVEEDKLLLARTAISIADILINDELFDQNELNDIQDEIQEITFNDEQDFIHHPPLYYVNCALEYLSHIVERDDEVLTTEAYGHQIAGIILSNSDFTEAAKAFRTALATSFKIEPKIACHLLSDIYHCMGLLYEQQSKGLPIQENIQDSMEDAMVYFAASLFFNPESPNSSPQSELSLVNSLFDTIYRALDPCFSPLSANVMRDFIDSLIFTYYCLSDKVLPNPVFCQQLAEADTLNTFAQHIFWLVLESYRRENPHTGLLEIAEPIDIHYSLEMNDILNALSPNKNNVHYLPAKENFTTIPV